MKKSVFSARFLAEAGIIAALYFVLTVAVQPLAFGQLNMIQMRVSEALCILPFFTPAAVPGLFVGCALANTLSPFGLYDIVFGSLATLIAVLITYRIKNKWLLPLPTIIINGLIVGAELTLLAALPEFGFLPKDAYLVSVAYVAAGEAVATYVLGMPLFFLLNKHKDKLFLRR